MDKGRIKGIVFDLDGTIIHSDIDFTEMKLGMIGVLEANGIPEGLLTPRQTTVVIIATANEIWEADGKAEAEVEEVMESLDGIMNEGELRAIPRIREIEGAREALAALRGEGYSLAILTRSHHEYAVEALRMIGALDHFDVILGRAETPEPKPHPEALFHTAKLLRLKPEETVFVGDNHIDASSARNSEVPFIGVRTGPRGDRSWADNTPEVLLDSVKDIPRYMKTAA